MHINFGCGRRVLPGFFNVDAQRHPKAKKPPDLLFDMQFTPEGKLRHQLPLDDHCADLLQCMHVIEHFYEWEARAVLMEFKRLLTPGGKLILELPNIELACRNLLKGLDDQFSMWPLYGNPEELDPYMCHKWGYTPQTLTTLLQSCGYKKILFLEPQTHGRRLNRDMRFEAIA